MNIYITICNKIYAVFGGVFKIISLIISAGILCGLLAVFLILTPILFVTVKLIDFIEGDNIEDR